MDSKFFENVVTTHFTGNSYESIYADNLKWVDLADKEYPFIKTATKTGCSSMRSS